ncbi:MAG: FHA domain-containing protein [Chloroflexota bacterium]
MVVQAEEIRLLIKISGPNPSRDEVVVGRNGLRVGRSGDNDLALNHREISRQHMRITWNGEEDKYFIEDLNSSNGVWLNEARLLPRVQHELDVGDVIRAGPFLLRVENFVYTPRPVLPARPRSIEEAGEQLPPVPHRITEYPPGVPRDASTWLKNLPEVYHYHDFLGRYLLIFESMFAPLQWIVDNFDLYLDTDIAPQEWLSWMAGWFDIILLEDLPIEQQRRIMDQVGWLYMRRGTRAGLSRMLELFFGVSADIIEDDVCHFTVTLPLSESKTNLGRDVADRIITAQKPAFASYRLIVT